ncbi:MAG: MmcQ/YjbR family DNA-binding protein [Opitutae bacterium]|nr:MmcQ/YjbR family DNA-binding protein [Opitutae bacterium]
MISPARVRQLALALPGTEELAHHGTPDFRVHGKIFATLPPGQNLAVVKLALADQADLVRSDPQAFSLNAWSKQGWTNVHLGHVAAAQMRELLDAAWRHVAPKKLVAQSEAENG